jgi:two-component system nitrate/nitrite response regulator NarL
MSVSPIDDHPTRVLVVDDHPLFRKGVADLLALEPNLAFVGEAADGQEGLRLAAELEPDMILLDMNMKGWDGIETLRRLRASPAQDARILMLTVSDTETDVVGALRAGADGYLLKDMEPEDILEQLREAMRGRLVISPQLTDLLARALRAHHGPTNPNEAGLTQREGEVLELLAKGFSNKLIARELDLAVGTVKVHVKNLLKKLGLNSRVEAAVWSLNTRGDSMRVRS